MERIGNMMKNVSKLIIGETGTPGMKQIIASIFTISQETFKDMTPKQLKASITKVEGLEKIFNVALQFGDMLAKINDIAPGIGAAPAGGAADPGAKLSELLNAVITMMEGEGEGGGIKELVNVLSAAAQGMPTGKNFSQQVKNMNSLMQGIPEVVNAMGPISTMIGSSALDETKTKGMGLLFKAICNVLFGGEGGMGAKEFAKQLAKLGGKDFDTAASNISETSVSLSAMFNNMTGMINALTGEELLAKVANIDALKQDAKMALASFGRADVWR